MYVVWVSQPARTRAAALATAKMSARITISTSELDGALVNLCRGNGSRYGNPATADGLHRPEPLVHCSPLHWPTLLRSRCPPSWRQGGNSRSVRSGRALAQQAASIKVPAMISRRELHVSPNGDRWLLVHDEAKG